MAAMAPALTDATAETHHIRFKLAPASSTLSPGSAENNGNANNILITASGTKKKIIGTEDSLNLCSNTTKEDRGKLQPLVASYLCSDVTSVSSKESLKRSGVFSKHTVLKPHTILSQSLYNSELLGKQPQVLEISLESLKNMNNGGPPLPSQAPVNGLAKKLSKSASSESENYSSFNGGKLVPSMLLGSSFEQSEESDIKDLKFAPTNCTLGSRRSEAGQAVFSNVNTSSKPLEHSEDRGLPKSEGRCSSVSEPDSDLKSRASVSFAMPSGSLDLDIRQRTLLLRRRQSEIENRACRLRKRLQVVQAKQVERHIHQQLGGIAEKSLGKLPNLDSQRHRSPVHTRKVEAALRRVSNETSTSEGLGSILKLDSISAELERFALSATTNLHSVERTFDSDVTESSSGGESDIEEEELTKADGDLHHIPLQRRAEWRWAEERAAIVCRWNWLQAHVSDLEYRIRQQTDYYKQIRASKGAVILGDPPPSDQAVDHGPDSVCVESKTDSSVCIFAQQSGADRSIERSEAVEQKETLSTDSKVPSQMPIPNGQEEPGMRSQGTSNILLNTSNEKDNATVTSEHEFTFDFSLFHHEDDSERTGALPKRQLPVKTCSDDQIEYFYIKSLQPGMTDHSSPDNSDAEELLSKKQRLNLVPLLPDGTCVSARTRPIVSCKKRRLVRPNHVAQLSRRVQRCSGVRANCDVNPACCLCGSRTSVLPEIVHEAALLERLSQLDSCIHPVLSFPDDVPVSLHFQTLMKSLCQNKQLDRIRLPKKFTLKHKVPSSSSLMDPSRKDKHKLTNSFLAAAKLSHHKNRSERIPRQHLDDLFSVSKLERTAVSKSERPLITSLGQDKHYRKRLLENPTERTEVSRSQVDTSNSGFSVTSTHIPIHNALVRQLSASSENSTPSCTNAMGIFTAAVRRRRGESSFDINNIVIPMSVAATTRVEKLQYKEILTPAWKVDALSFKGSPKSSSDAIEDLSDAAFANLHMKYEESERSRWTWTSKAPAQRRGSRSYKSTDGRTTPLLGSTNPSTPQPASPDGGIYHSFSDLQSTSSPLSPISPDLQSAPHTPASRDSRLFQNEDTRSSTPDIGYDEPTVQPWERRSFPLSFDPKIESEDQLENQERPGRSTRRISGNKPSKETETLLASSLLNEAKPRHPTVLRPAHR
ncbi:KAT8 regulatory NSL complex subunit 1 [Protopterus annectens]|uniref:KAT8 regulatory NSL complex subunit 1 n=1 Tax=Protopterus annectens TaxID=7888 RepID=UPI001CFAF2A5|nr:KAT8 regulatory NSL complex subunit 1 [Protopterus annectens]